MEMALVALVAAIRADEENAMENGFAETFSSGTIEGMSAAFGAGELRRIGAC